MRIGTVASLLFMAGALSACGNSSGAPGRTVEFVASNTDSVLLDFEAKPPGELAAANETAAQQCQIFHRSTAVLESLNVRREGKIRATYLCRNGVTRTVDNSMEIRRRQ